MSGDIYFGLDLSVPDSYNDGYVNTPTFMAFGDLMEEALSKDYSSQLAIIKESEPMAIYSYIELSRVDYNSVIRAMREYIASLTNPTDWQQKGAWVWSEMAEPFIRKDERYDFAFHGEAPSVP